MKKHNFSAGPCILPQEVLIQASKAVLNFNNSNLSLIEISHRSKDFVEVMEKAQRLVKELLDLPKGYSVLFLQGGASTQFLMSCMNLLKTNGSAAYINTGTWSDKAIKEAEKFGKINVIGSSQDKNYSYIPKNLNCPVEMDYLHFTSNNTIFGTQFQDFPIVSENTLLVCDMSSDIFSRKFNISKFDLIYAGAQKNMGPAGTTLVIVKDEILQQTGRDIPSMLDYSIHIKKKSMFNTPPVFPIYVSMLTLEWLKNNGGVEWIEQINKQKAELLYNEIDQNYLFEGVAAKEDRSKMNVTFILTDKSKEEEFDQAWHNAGINGLKGHRSVGGYRASMYNALPLSSVQILVDVMHNL
tara:strand:- start:4461 stop:5522 length:1062 start_codon:yes stop_codon:yes gene_type:complete